MVSLLYDVRKLQNYKLHYYIKLWNEVYNYVNNVILSLNHDLELKLELAHVRKNSSKLGSSLT